MTGVELIAAERERQVSVEQWTPKHDDGHELGELACAAACYAMPGSFRMRIKQNLSKSGGFETILEMLWPFEQGWWKPTPEDRIRELVKAGALIAAEIDRLGRTDE